MMCVLCATKAKLVPSKITRIADENSLALKILKNCLNFRDFQISSCFFRKS